MDRFQYEAFGKKIALFYHPLFRKTIEAWATTFASQSKNINILIFMEINVRIQKAMIYPADTTNSMNSALTDWYKELEDISLREKKPTNSHKNNNATKFNLPDLGVLYNSMQFEACVSQEYYTAFFKQHRQHIAMKYSQTFLSLVGFSKFLFDLCVSWCENIDIELFIYFLNGLFLHITSGETLKTSSLRSLEKIELFHDTFYNFFKTQKAHYQRYVKGNLNSLQPWCEWNYFRIKEIKNKFLENFLQIFPESEKQRILDLQEIFDAAQAEIPSDLTTFNLETLSQFQQNDVLNMKLPSGRMHLEPLSGSSINGKLTHKKEAKKVSMPVIGRSLVKSNTDDPNAGVVKTIDSVTFFLDDVGESHLSPNLDLFNNDGLYPIWERELSECNSTISFRDYKQSKFAMNATQQDFINDEYFPQPPSPNSVESLSPNENYIKIRGSNSEKSPKIDFISVVEGRMNIDNDQELIIQGKEVTPSLEKSDSMKEDSKDLAQTLPPKSSSKGFASQAAQIFQQKSPNSIEPGSFSGSFSNKSSNKLQPDLKRGGYVFNKRKQNLVSSFNSAQGHFPTDIDLKEAEKGYVPPVPERITKFLTMPKLIPKPLQGRKEGLARPRSEKENLLSQRKTSLKRLTQIPRSNNFDNQSVRSEDLSIGISKDSINMPRSHPDLDRNIEKIRQVYSSHTKLESIKLPKATRDQPANDSLEINGQGPDRGEFISKAAGILTNGKRLDLRKELAEIGSKSKIKKTGESKSLLPRPYSHKH